VSRHLSLCTSCVTAASWAILPVFAPARSLTLSAALPRAADAMLSIVCERLSRLECNRCCGVESSSARSFCMATQRGDLFTFRRHSYVDLLHFGFGLPTSGTQALSGQKLRPRDAIEVEYSGAANSNEDDDDGSSRYARFQGLPSEADLPREVQHLPCPPHLVTLEIRMLRKSVFLEKIKVEKAHS
jgi:hypothetical protein